MACTSDILLKDKGQKVEKGKVAQFINDYFINVGNFSASASPATTTAEIDQEVNDLDSLTFERIEEFSETVIYRIISDINVSKSSGLDNVSSFIVKEAFKALIVEVTYLFNLSICTQ